MSLLRALYAIGCAQLLTIHHIFWRHTNTTKCFNGRILYLRCMDCGWESRGIDLGEGVSDALERGN